MLPPQGAAAGNRPWGVWVWEAGLSFIFFFLLYEIRLNRSVWSEHRRSVGAWGRTLVDRTRPVPGPRPDIDGAA